MTEWPRLTENGPDSVTLQLGPGMLGGPLAEQDLTPDQARALKRELESFLED